MMITSCPGFRIQPDWDKSLTAGEKEIWFHQYENGITKYHKLERQGSSFVPDADNCRCYYYPPNVLRIQSISTGVRRTFQSADSIVHLPYSKERPPRIHLSCMDVSPSGELILSASSDRSIDLWESSSGQVRRSLEGHVAEVYSCRFFPSGLAALTAGADMQLKIWCLLTGNCAATLAPGLAGGVTGVDADSCNEPGGHRAGIMDTGIIHRGRNILAVDRAGWLRLWDVGTQICISAIPLVSGACNQTVGHSVLEEATCLAVKKFGDLPVSIDNVSPDQPWYCVLETVSTTAVQVGISDALVAVGMGSGGLMQLYDLNARSRGCVAQFTLPTACGSVESCTFVHSTTNDPSDVASTPSSTQSSPQGSPVNSQHHTESIAFGEYGLAAGGQNGEVACWDLRHPKRTLLHLTHEKGAAIQLQLLSNPGGRMVTMIVGRSDGRVFLYSLGPGVWITDAVGPGPDISHIQWSTLELTGINCEPVRGLSTVSTVSSRDYPFGVWTASHSGVFRHYRTLATKLAFD